MRQQDSTVQHYEISLKAIARQRARLRDRARVRPTAGAVTVVAGVMLCHYLIRRIDLLTGVHGELLGRQFAHDRPPTGSSCIGSRTLERDIECRFESPKLSVVGRGPVVNPRGVAATSATVEWGGWMDSEKSDAMRRVFGLVLRQLRGQAGLSLRALGVASHYDYSRLSRVENGQHLVDPALVPALDDAVGAGGLLITLRSLVSNEPISGPMTLPGVEFRVDDGDSVRLKLRTPDGRTVHVSLSRREFNHLIATGVLQAALPAGVVDTGHAERIAKVQEQPSRVDRQVLEYFRVLLTEHFTADRMLGPRRLLGPVCAQMDVLDELRRHARPGTAQPLLRLMAQYAEFAGWLHQDAGDTTAAMYWSDRATQWAQAVGDNQMLAYLLVRKSNIALLDHDAVTAIELAAAARKHPGPISPRLVALARQQEARGWALHGEVDQFRAGVDTAVDLLNQDSGELDDTAPVYLQQYDLDALEEQTASGYRTCGQAETAVAILERMITRTDSHLHRDRGHQLAKLANAVIATAHPDPERAATLGLACVPTARQTGSARIAKELAVLDEALWRRWPDLSGTVQLREALAA